MARVGGLGIHHGLMVKICFAVMVNWWHGMSSWFLETVVIKCADTSWIFPCSQWLDDKKGSARQSLAAIEGDLQRTAETLCITKEVRERRLELVTQAAAFTRKRVRKKRQTTDGTCQNPDPFLIHPFSVFPLPLAPRCRAFYIRL